MEKKDIYKEILHLSIPASLEVVFQILLGLIDMIFVGKLGTDALAGVSLTNQVVTLLLLVYGTIGVGASILISQYYGKADTESMSIYSGQAIIFGVFVGIISAIITMIFAQDLLQLMGAERSVVAAGTPFFRIIALSMPLSLLSIVIGAILRSIGNTKIPLAITSVSVLINTFLNYVFIFGIGGIIPAFGVIGSAYATLIAKLVSASLVFYYLFFVNKTIRFKIAHLFTVNKEKLLQVIQLTYPVALGELIWVIGTFIYLILFTRLGTNSLVASQIVLNIENLFIMFSFGISISALTLVAKEIGANNFSLMSSKANKILKVGLIASVIFGLLLFATSFCVHFFYPDISADANNLARWGLAFYAMFQPIKVLNMIMGNGILKAGGITKFVAIVDILVAFIIGLPAAYILGIHFGFGFQGIMFGRILEEISRLVIFMIRYKTPNWYRVLAVEQQEQ